MFKPIRKRQAIDKWADQYKVFPQGSAEHKSLHSNRTHDMLMGAQIGKTKAHLNMMRCRLHHDLRLFWTGAIVFCLLVWWGIFYLVGELMT